MNLSLPLCLTIIAPIASLGAPPPLSAQPNSAAPITAAKREALWSSRGCEADARGKWFRDAKFGAFIHFGVYSQLGGYWHGQGPYRPAEQIMGLGEHRAAISPEAYRNEAAGAFNPANFDARAWVSAIKRAGQRYVIVTAKHHDGFAMFRTTTTHYNVMEATPFARDVIKELAEECAWQGIAFCPYYSIGDWSEAKVRNPQFGSYREYMFAQLKELLTQYGSVPLVWFDNYWYVDQQWQNDESHAKDLYSFVRDLSPSTLVNDRCGAGVNSADGDYATPENQLKGSRQSRYFEVVMTNTDDDNWGWVRTAKNYRKPQDLIRNLIDCTSKGGNFVLNVGPTASGEFPAEHLAILDAMGDWLRTNGEAIYGCDPAPECISQPQPGLIAYSTKNSTAIYVLVASWPAAGPARFEVQFPGRLTASWLNPVLPPVEFTTSEVDGRTILSITPPKVIGEYPTVLKLTNSR